MAYPILVPPDELFATNRRQWSAKQAALYRDWLIANLDRRVDGLLAFLSYSSPVTPERLSDVGRHIEPLLRTPEFSVPTPTGLALTNAGFSLGGDVGLLVARLLLSTHPTLSWTVVRRPKSDVSYNLPVLAGFTHERTLDPVEGGIGEARALLKGKAGPDAWQRMYDYWAASTVAQPA